MNDIAALLERVERGLLDVEGEPPLNEAVARAFFTVVDHGNGPMIWDDDDDRPAPGRWHREMPDFIGSIDAALALVEKVLPGFEWSKGHNDLITIFWRKEGPPRPIAGQGWHYHVPLAILAALLRSLTGREG